MDSEENISNPDDIFKYLQSCKFLNECGLIDMIGKFISKNPYGKNSNEDNDKSAMWKEQYIINFPILYLASVYL